MRLLYAEDEPALSEAVVDYLTYHKYIVDDCKNTQLCDLKKTRCIVVKEAKEREISCFESIRLN